MLRESSNLQANKFEIIEMPSRTVSPIPYEISLEETMKPSYNNISGKSKIISLTYIGLYLIKTLTVSIRSALR